MNLNSFLCRFPTVFCKYIRILDQVSQIRQFHWISFEFQRFQNRPQICFLDIYHRLYNNINNVRNIKLFVTSIQHHEKRKRIRLLNTRGKLTTICLLFLPHHRSSAHEHSSLFQHLMYSLLSKLSTPSNDRIRGTTHSENARHLLVWVYNEWCVDL